MSASRPPHHGAFDDRRQAATTIARGERCPPSSQLFRCEAFATLDSPDRQSAIIRPMFWLSRVTVSGPEAAVAWVVDRLERFAQLLDGPDVSHAAQVEVPPGCALGAIWKPTRSPGPFENARDHGTPTV
ncbi:hypothetical protein [Streptomyces sp. NBRC 110028]|uniref:hypothetical protein n=1 Tax=Streptomyces sp. NBRC 110028 TaxID=1621260 RepID=UPI0006E3C6CC|nr:hypothetical protein [Streptomyces sp. NBRC 110028]